MSTNPQTPFTVAEFLQEAKSMTKVMADGLNIVSGVITVGYETDNGNHGQETFRLKDGRIVGYSTSIERDVYERLVSQADELMDNVDQDIVKTPSESIQLESQPNVQ